MQLEYGIVTLRRKPLVNIAAMEFRVFLAEAEQAVLVQEVALVERWVPAVVGASAQGRGAGRGPAG